jgi:ADP-ribose pyrophosphatase YjhB (NUDIX family)
MSATPPEAFWLEWVREMQAIAQNGLTYAKDPFDRERYEQLRRLAARVAEHCTQVPAEQLAAWFNAEGGYATPKIDVRGVVFRDGRILLVKERSDGRWTLPGGWADVGDSPREAVEREVREESGYETRATKMLAVYDRNKHDHPPFMWHVYKLFILCELVGGEAKTSIETEGVDFFAEDELPELSLTRVVEKQIRRFFEHARNPEMPTDFD